jgi:mRNA interferase HicA
MKRSSLLRHLRFHGCYLKREGRAHSLWTNPKNGSVEAVPRHVEVSNNLARKICRNLSIPEVGKED